MPAPGPARPAPSVLAGDEPGLRRLHLGVLRLRDALVVLLAVVAFALPTDDPRPVLVAAALIGVVLPYNVLLRRAYLRTGRVPGVMAWADQALVAAFVLAWPEVLAPALVLAMLDVAVAAVLLDRRAATVGGAAGALVLSVAVGVTLVRLDDLPWGYVLCAPAYAVSAVTTAWMVGAVAGRDRRGRQELSSLLRSLPVVVYEMDAETLAVRYVSPRVTDLLGRPASDFLGDPAEWVGVVHRRDQPALLQLVGGVTSDRETFDCTYRVFTAAGDVRWVHNVTAAETVEGRRLLRGSIADVTEQKLAEDALARAACTDALTGLPNRAGLLDQLATAAADAAPSVLVLVDVDAFQRINDSLGHLAGDDLLGHVAARLGEALRSDDRVARLGGDEFAVLARLEAADDAEAVVRRVLAVFDAPFDLGARTVRVTASAGAVVLRRGEAPADETPEGLLQCADAAMYEAKRSGPGRVSFYDDCLRTAALARLDVESELRTALAEQQFFLVYQPIVRAGDHEVVGHEALVRWRHPVRGLVSPADFVPVAESTGQIVEIGRWVLREACRQARAWWDDSGVLRHMSVNLSARQLSDAGLVDDVARALADCALPASALSLEVTETALIANPAEALSALERLRRTGVAVALDDFGTGYSSLSHLHAYPVDTVKIDRSFVARMDDAAGGIVTAILHLASHMDLTVVAEGVESLEHAAALHALGCDLLQGYALGRPAPALPSPRVGDGRTSATTTT